MYMNNNFDFGLTKYRYDLENLDPVFATKLDLFACIAEPTVSGSISLFDLIEMIRYNFNTETFLIHKYLDDNKTNPVYDEIKLSSPTVCYNANFNGYKDLKHLISPTNLMFLDIDGFKTNQEAEAYKNDIVLKYNWIIACSLSMSRLGMHIIIFVDKILNNADYNSKYKHISTKYFDGKLDLNALSLSRHAVIPYDQNIYVNYNPIVLNTEDIIKFIEESVCSESSEISTCSNNNDKSICSSNKKEKVISTPCTFLLPEIDQIMNDSARKDGLRFSIPLDESYFTDPNIPKYFYEGREVVEINLHPFKKSKVADGHRTTSIGAITMQMIYLNAASMSKTDLTTKEAIQKFMSMVNRKICNPPLSHREVINSFNSNWQRYLDGDMDFANCFKLKKAFWSPLCTIHGIEKLKVTCEFRDRPTKADSRKKINDAIGIVNGRGKKVTQKNVAACAGMNVQTVKKYWNEFKSQVKDLNNKNAGASSTVSSDTIMKVSHSKTDLKYTCVA